MQITVNWASGRTWHHNLGWSLLGGGLAGGVGGGIRWWRDTRVLQAPMALLPMPPVQGRLTIEPSPRIFFVSPDGVASTKLGIQFPTWQLGQPITQLTSTGEYPKWFSRLAREKVDTISGRYWMNRALLSQPGEFTTRQLRSMQAGFAPSARVELRRRTTGVISVRDVAKELHHSARNRGVAGYDEPVYLWEMWPWEHELLDDYRHFGYDVLRFVS